jgi:hypothetical protein
MAAETKKTETPPYNSYGTLANFIKGLKETGIPSRIDKSILGKLSGSAQSALIAALKWLALIDDAGLPTEKMEALVNADDATYPQILSSVLRERYKFIDDGTITLAKATGSQVEQKFREYGITGSTVIKCIAFFISACNAAKIPLGPHVKAPKALPVSGAKKRARKNGLEIDVFDSEESDDEEENGIPVDMPGFVKIPIPLHGMEDGAVFLPDNMTKAQWAYALKIAKFLIENYRQDDAPDGAGAVP